MNRNGGIPVAVKAPGRDAEAVQGRQQRGEGPFLKPIVAGEDELPPADGGHSGEDPHGRPIVAQVDLPARIFQAAAGATHDEVVLLPGGDDGPQGPEGSGEVHGVLRHEGAAQQGLPPGEGGKDQRPLGVALGTGHGHGGVQGTGQRSYVDCFHSIILDESVL